MKIILISLYCKLSFFDHKTKEYLDMNKIFFPTLHHELVGDKILKEVTLVNPGLFEEDEQRSCNYFRPRKFPLKTKEAQKYIKDFFNVRGFFLKIPGRLSKVFFYN